MSIVWRFGDARLRDCALMDLGGGDRCWCALRFLGDGDGSSRAGSRSRLGDCDGRGGGLNALGDGHGSGGNCNRVAQDDGAWITRRGDCEVVAVERLSVGSGVHLEVELGRRIEVPELELIRTGNGALGYV